MVDGSVLVSIRRELKRHIDPVYRDGARRFFKEEVNVLGVRTPIVRNIAGRTYSDFRTKARLSQFRLCDELLSSGVFEEATIALDWMSRIAKTLEPRHFAVLERWLKRNVSNWATCDDICTHVIGPFLVAHPSFAPNVFAWTSSKNRWMRRASAVCLITPVRKHVLLNQVFKTADRLLLDKDDLVQKGYGWTLKVAGDVYFQDVSAYVMARRKTMPRVALRYAIEKYPEVARIRILAK